MRRRHRAGEPGPVRLTAPLAAAVAAAAAATAVFTAWTVFRLHVVLPAWDEWAIVADTQRIKAGTYDWTALAAQRNEHRLLFPMLLFLADHLLFGMQEWSLLAATFVLQAVTAATLIRLGVPRAEGGPARLLLAGLTVLLLFTLRQADNFGNGFQVQFVGVFTAAALAAALYADALVRLREGGGGAGARLAGAAFCCFASTYTMANGVLAGFVLAGAALLARAPRRLVLGTAGAAAALALLFFHGYRPGDLGWPLSRALAHPLPYLRYVTTYLGNPLGTSIRLTQALGVAGLAGFGAGAWRVATGRERGRDGVALLAVAGFVIASACATAYGRISLGTEQAFSGRYATPSEILWAALALFWVPLALRRGPGRAVPRPAAAIPALGLVGVLAASAVWHEVAAWTPLARQAAAFRRFSDSLSVGLYDADAARYENQPEAEIRGFLPFLRAERLSLFAAPDPVGRPLAALGGLAPGEACRGGVRARAAPSLGGAGVRLEGEAGTGVPREARVVVADRGIVVGLGSAGGAGGWTGYARAEAGTLLSAYARLADGRLCRLGTATVEAVP